MPYEPLHHKYRPQTFSDLVGQETIALTLSNALTKVKIAPAYLFTGPRGTGKTSSARILAKSLNCLASSQPTPHPCGKCEACLAIAKGSALDVMEIDAASNTGVDNIREIIERSRFAPVQCRYKIYAIDECHMLSTAAFNALLKTLEEPPPQVVFILATTDPQRVLSTIISRCQRFDYRRIPLRLMTNHLKYIAGEENIAIADEALTLIAQIANGGLRDAESLLDQLSLLPESISVAKVWDLVGAVPEQDLLILLQAINGNDTLAVLEQCRSLLDRGREPLVVLQNLASFYLNLLIAKTAPQRPDLTAVTETCWQQLCGEASNWDTPAILRGQQHLKEAETQLKRTTQPRLWLEVTLLGLLPEARTAIANSTVTVVNSPTTPSQSQSLVNSQISPPATPKNTEPALDVIPTKNIAPAPLNSPQTEPKPVEVLNHHFTEQKSPTGSKAVVEKAVADELTSVSVSQSVTPNLNQDPVANREIWSKVVSCLQPPTTQALLKQQCHLVSFDGNSAIVGISSAKLQKLNQGKVPNIEVAFAQVCQRKVKVQLEVANTKVNSAANSTNNSSSATKQSTAEVTPSLPEKPPINVSPHNHQTVSATAPDEAMPPSKPVRNLVEPKAEQSFTPSLNPVQSATTNDNSEFSQNQVKAIATPQNSVLPVIPSISENSDNNVKITQGIAEPDSNQQDYDNGYLQKAIDNLTHSFEGELVQLDDMETPMVKMSESNDKAEPVSNLDRPNTDDYDDDW